MAPNAPLEVTSTSHWNTTLRSAKETGQTIIVDFHAEWCGPCKTIAPIYAQLASQFPQCIFLRVDVDRQKPIAAKYGVSAMPTFIAIKSGAQAPGALVRGADAQGLRALVMQHAGPNPPVPPLPADAEAAKAAGNAAFAAGDYAAATEHYTRALALAPKSAQLLGNRSFAHMKRYAQTKDAELRTQAMQDARQATVLDGRWGKGWVRLGEVCVAEADDADPTDHPDGKRKALEEAEEAFTKAVGLSEGKVKTEAQQKLEAVRASLQAL